MMPADPRFISFSLPAFHLSLTMLIKASLKPAWYLKLVDVRLRAWRRALSSLLKPAGIELPVVQLVQQWIHYNAHLTPCKTNTCAIQVGWALLHTCRALVSFVFRLWETTFSHFVMFPNLFSFLRICHPFMLFNGLLYTKLSWHGIKSCMFYEEKKHSGFSFRKK